MKRLEDITAGYSGDANDAGGTSAAVAVSVTQASSAIQVTSSANPSFAGQNVTLSAHVTSSGPTPTGSVTFLLGTNALGSAPLSGGSATYATSSLATVGTQAITASYAGDANTQASSAMLNQVVNAPFSVAPGSGGSTTLTVNSGHTATTPIDVTAAPGYSGQVVFACSGLPANASCSFNPTTVTLSGTATVSTLLSVSTVPVATIAQLGGEGGSGLYRVAYSLGLATLFLCWPLRRRGVGICAMLVCLCSLAATGCGSSGPRTAPGTYNFVVTATSGTVQTTSAYTLTVQ